MKTYMARLGDVERRWLLVDAEGQTLGRLATHIAMALRGKHRPTYTPHLDTGDHVIVVNAEKVRLTGAKVEKERLFRHTMYPGGVRWTALSEVMDKHPERVVTAAVRGMMPKTKLGRAMMKKLKVYRGSEHPHEAQQPVTWAPATRTRNG
jgi:large subunit ribosomal protein L13